MRPERLTIENFGPFHGEKVVVDFTALDRLFLVAGETGAGKTTLFDAMCFALYGKPLGTRDGGSLRSQRAAADEPTSVELVFRLRDRRYKVARSPEFVRKKKRGEGTTTSDQQVAFYREVDGTFVADTGKTTEVNKKIVDEVGLSFDNFSQILVLPQGQFQQFLEMSTDERAKLLERLFPVTEHRQLIARAKEDAKRCTDELTKRATLLDSLVEGGLDPAQVEERSSELRRERDAADEAWTEAERVWVAATAALQAADVLTRSFDEHDAASAARDACDARAEGIDAARRAIARSDRARRVAQVAERKALSDRALADARAEASVIAGRAAAHAAKAAVHATRAVERAQLEDERRALEAERPLRERRIEDLTAVVAIRRDLRTSVLDTDARRSALAELATAIAADEERAKAFSERRAALEDATSARTDQGETLRGLESGSTAAAFLAGASAARATMDADVDAAEVERAAAVASLRDAQTALTSVDEAIARDRAASIAATLVEGAPCPVCGSHAHPDPAIHGELAAVLDRSRKQAIARIEECTSRLQAADRAVGVAEDRVRGQRAREESERATLARLGFDSAQAWSSAVAGRRDALAAVDASIAAIRRELVDAAALEKILASRRAESTRLTDELVERSGVRAALEGKLAERRAAIGQVADDEVETFVAAEVARATRDAGRRDAIATIVADLDAAVTELADEAHAVALARAANEARLAACAATSGHESDALDAALADAGFDDEAAARAALRPESVDQEDARQVEEHVRESQRAQDALARLTPLVAGRSRPERALLAADEAAARLARDETAERRRVAISTLESFEGRAKAYAEGRAEYAAFEQRSKAILALARDLSGDNAARVDFAKFALERFLDAVLTQASLRFLRLTSGRYEFVLDVTVDDRRSGAGLDIDVFDAHVGARRDVKTLSGGEKFLASLSLALGLSDVIEARAGGVALDALFIDEGFGSLDGEALDRALSVLDEVGASRMVGVISHVESMRSAIPSQIRVERGALGSRVVLV